MKLFSTPFFIGWLISAARDLFDFFTRSEQSQIGFQDLITQLLFCEIGGIPTELNNTRKIWIEKNTIETKFELITNGWELDTHSLKKRLLK